MRTLNYRRGFQRFCEVRMQSFRRGVVLVALMASLQVGSFSQQDPVNLTYGLVNGRMWQIMPDDVRTMYLIGLGEGMVRGIGLGEGMVRGGASQEVLNGYRPKGISFSEIKEAIDKVYAEPENRLIPVIDCLRIVTLKANGAPQLKVDAQLAALRFASGRAPERQQK